MASLEPWSEDDNFLRSEQSSTELANPGYSVIIYYHMYLQQSIKYLEVDLIGSKGTKQKQVNFIIQWTNTAVFQHAKIVAPRSQISGARFKPVTSVPINNVHDLTIEC